ncbi:pyridoxamine 5'-phosphate oxidase family protein [Actinomadura oligospora]|uniref:pyridoxamine 5'-phosphate oxidase family protein n=1 Tax=Actinomadura oligospora TaxID=111804 RepID=UPI0004B82D8E|nr:pyridoxamine 5'-phosphate oxidase family protein [Actinomadura oligospora]
MTTTGAEADTGLDHTALDHAALDHAALDHATCLRLLGGVAVGRIAWCACDGRAIVVPVTFVLDGDAIIAHAFAGSGLRAVRTGRPLTFEADDVGPAPHTGWSVLVRGLAEVVDDRHAVRWPTASTRGEDEPAPFLIRIPASEVTGQRLSP